MEIGGGRGGDAMMWVRHPTVELVDVIEPDETAVCEYQRRLAQSFHGVPHKHTVVLPPSGSHRSLDWVTPVNRFGSTVSVPSHASV